MPKSRVNFLVLALDIGTSSARTALFNSWGERLPETGAAESYQLKYGGDGRAELSPADLLRAVDHAQMRTLKAYRKVRASKRPPIAAIAGSALWHGLLGLDRGLR